VLKPRVSRPRPTMAGCRRRPARAYRTASRLASSVSSVPPTRSAWGSIVPTSRLRDQETCVRYSLTRPSCGRIIRAVRRGEWGRGAASVRRRLFRRTWRVGSDNGHYVNRVTVAS